MSQTGSEGIVALIFLLVGVVTLLPSGFLFAHTMRQNWNGLCSTLVKTSIFQVGIVAVIFTALKGLGVFFFTWEPLMGVGAALINALISTVLVFRFRR